MKQPKVFVIQSFDEASEGVYQLIVSAVAKAGAIAYRADSIPVGANIADSIHKAIQTAELLIADVTNANPNVMYEVGFARSQKKPLIFIARGSRAIPFDLTGIRVVIYDLGSRVEFVERLTRAIQEALKQPSAFALTDVTTGREKRQNVFISYSRNDREYLERLLVHLKPLEKEGLVDLWVDTRLRAGDRWKKEVEKALDRATVAILMVSADFLASDFITDNELPPILRNAEEKGTRIIPLIVKPCRFTRDKNLRQFQAINDPKEALVLIPEGEQERYYDALSAEVERTLQRG